MAETKLESSFPKAQILIPGFHHPFQIDINNRSGDLLVYVTAQKMKFSIKDFFSKCYQIRSFLRIWSHLLKKSLIENFIFCAVYKPPSMNSQYLIDTLSDLLTIMITKLYLGSSPVAVT